MRLLRRVRAECLLVGPRFTRTRLGVSLLALGLALVWLATRGLEPLTTVLHAGALGAVLGAAGMAGSRADRAALSIALAHPTTPLAIALGRWIAAVAPAAVLVIACTLATHQSVTAAAAGAIAAAAIGGFTLAAVLAFGKGAALVLFLFMAVAGAVEPERLVGLAHPGMMRIAAASALELGPALWHYRDIVTGDQGAVLHALAWAGLGVLSASGLIGQRR